MSNERPRTLAPYLSPAGAWALALGTSLGWGSVVITSNTYLSQAGPLGSVLGIVFGALIMLVISRNYAYLMNCYPEAGGAYAFLRDTFGYDHGFLTAWFLALTYLAIFWANATALPLFARYFLGDLFRFGYLYQIFGYDVYLGEVLLSVAAILLFILTATKGKRIIQALMIGMVCFFSLAIIICFAAAFLLKPGDITPYFVPETKAISQIVRIAVISPWAFIGFENISHATEEFRFPHNRIFRVLVVSVITTAVLYILVTLLSVTAYPPEYESWLAYIRDLGNLGGIKALPAFYAADAYLGSFGILLLMLALLALIFTSLFGNSLALSRLFYAMAKDEILPKQFSDLTDKGIPANAFFLVAGLSVLIPLVGRTAVGWIVDVTTVGAILIYGMVSAAARKMANVREDRVERITGMAGLVIMIGFGIYLFVPNLFGESSMATESYFLFVVWGVIGFLFFRRILQHDRQKRFGQSIIVWIGLLSMILFVSLVWMSQATLEVTHSAMVNVQDYYVHAGIDTEQTEIFWEQMERIRRTNVRSILMVVALFATSLGVLLSNFALISKRAKESERELGIARNLANTDQLTGVKSKHAYAEKETAVDQKIAAGEVEPFAVVVCDVNGLKVVNDTLGHKAGDAYIRSACRMICELFQHSPVYRIGGDEFVAYLAGRDYENREALLKELHELSVAHIASKEVVVSGGMSAYLPGKDTSMHQAFERADALMYEEKKLLKSLGAPART